MGSLLDNQTRLAPNEFFSQLGGGGNTSSIVGPNIVASTLTVSTILGGGPIQSLAFPNGMNIAGGASIAFGAKGAAGNDITFAGNGGALSGVSTINGNPYPPPGSGGFTSSFSAVALPANTSTILMEMPAGQFGFNGEASAGGVSDQVSGFLSVLFNSGSSVWRGNMNVDTSVQQPTQTNTLVPAINTADSGLSTIKLFVCNNTASAGTFTGIVGKLY